MLTIPLGEPPANFERESNDSIGFANEIALNGSRSGLLYDKRDDDHYSFRLSNPSNVRLSLTQSENSNIRLALSRDGMIVVRLQGKEPGEPLLLESHLLEGEYSIVVDEQGPGSRDLYTMNLEQLDPFLQLTDIEPNSSFKSAEPAPVTLKVKGHSSQQEGLLPLTRLAK